MKKELLAVGIVTKNRRLSLMQLLKDLNDQSPTRLDVIINENGSDVFNVGSIKNFKNLRIAFKRQKDANIPRARNAILKQTKNKYRWIVFIDDDCTPGSKWLSTIAEFLKKQSSALLFAVQGTCISIPSDNPYALITGRLSDLWFEANSKGTSTSIIDTKNCALNLEKLGSLKIQFDERREFASDIDLGCRLNGLGQKKQVYYLRKWSVFHNERTSFLDFLRHRTRLALAFRSVLYTFPKCLVSVPLSRKASSLMSISMPLWNKTKALVGLSISYGVASILLLFKKGEVLH